MLKEFTFVAHALQAEESREAIKSLVVGENILLKPTEASRHKTLKYLEVAYGLDPQLPVYSGLRALWDIESAEQPMLALLCVSARDALLRATAEHILGLLNGTPVLYQELSDIVARAFPRRFSPASLKSVGQNILSTWTQSGHLSTGRARIRTSPFIGPASVTYALLLGYLYGERGQGLFHTFWAELLDAGTAGLDDNAVIAAQRGLIEYRKAGGVVDISFSQLLPESR